MDSKRDQLETRVATLELMLVTERARLSLTTANLQDWRGTLETRNLRSGEVGSLRVAQEKVQEAGQ